MKKLCVLLLLLFFLSSPALAAPELPEQRISIGHHTDVLMVAPGGELVVWGADELGFMQHFGFYGDTRDYSNRMTIVPGGVKAVTGTYTSALVLMDDGTLYGYGTEMYNNFAGNEPANYNYYTYNLYNSGSMFPIKVMEDVAMVSDSLGRFSALKTDGSVWCWGRDDDGELFNPVKVMDNCRSVSASYAVTDDGDLYKCGCTEYEAEYIASGVFAVGGTFVQLENGDLYNLHDFVESMSSGNGLPEPVAHDVRKICGEGYISESGELYSWYYTDKRFVKLLDNVVNGHCQINMCIAVTGDGKIYATTVESLTYETFQYLGPLDELAPEYEKSFNLWPVILQAELVFRKLLPLLPVLL